MATSSDLTPVQQQALARWHDLGLTTPTHPVLQLAYELYFQPMGVQIDGLIYDALAALPNRQNVGFTLVNPRWDAAKADKTWSQYPIIEPLVHLQDLLAPVFNDNGTLQEFQQLKEPTDEPTLKLMQEFRDKQAAEIFDLADALSVTTKLFMDASLELLIQPEPYSSELAQLFLDNPRHFAAGAFHIFSKQQPPAPSATPQA